MAKPWKLKTNSSNILLVLLTLIHITAGWSEEKKNHSWEYNNVDGDDHRIFGGNYSNGIEIYVGHDEIAQYFFNSSENNNFLILNNLNQCLKNFNFVTCLKLLLLEKINNFKEILNELNYEKKDLTLFNGLLSLKIKSDTNNNVESDGDNDNDDLNLDNEISNKIFKIFQNRLLRVNLDNIMIMDVVPVVDNRSRKKNIYFTYKFLEESAEESNVEERKKKSRFPMMLLPQLLMLGFLPFTLASLKSMVMNAVMINMMALNGAIFMLIRDIVFGERPNSNLQYVNYGYSKDRQKQRKRPVLIIHSSAAFVKQPKVHFSKKYNGNQHFYENNYDLNLNEFHHNYHQSFGKKNDFSRTVFEEADGQLNKNQYKILGKFGTNKLNNNNNVEFRNRDENGNEAKIADVYLKNSFNSNEINKSDLNYYTNNNKNNLARANQRIYSLKRNFKEHSSHETKPKLRFKFSAKISSLPPSSGRI